MATPPYDPKKAALYNQLRQRGLSEDEAWAQSGITEAETFNYVIGINGNLGANITRGSKVAGVDYERPSAAERAESDRWFNDLSAGDDDEPPSSRSGVFARATYPQAPSGQPAQQPSVKTIQSTTTAQETVTGGGETVTRIGVVERRDTPASRAVQTELDQTNAEIERRKQVLRAEGKNFREINRDPEIQTLKTKQTTQEIAVEDAKQTVEIAPPTVVTRPGPSGTTFQQTVDQQFLTTRTAGEDPTASLAEDLDFTDRGGPVRNFQARDVTDTGGVPTQSLADFEPVQRRFAGPVTDTGGVPSQSLADIDGDTGFVPRAEPEFVPDDLSPYGEQDDPFDPDLVTEPGQDEFQNELDNLRLAEERETRDFIASQQSDTGAQEPPEVDPDTNPQVPQGVPFDDDGNLNPGFTLDGDGNPVFIGDDFIDPSLTASAEATRAAARQQATLDNARKQATLQSQRKQGNDTDWRFRISLAPQSTYLYNAVDESGQPAAGILEPLRRTNGVIFPYTPQITTSYQATYDSYNLTHSNYRGFFYQGSSVADINVTATFTAQDTAEAEYLLAVIHFFRSATKMFYGANDAFAGTPPPLVYCRGFGEFQFNLHPCVIHTFNYVMPSDVDYIRARSKNINGTSLLQRRDRASLPTNAVSGALARLSAAGVPKGAISAPPSPPSLGLADATYVPTKVDLTLVLYPIQSREQISKQFNMKQFANGDLLKGGFW